MSFGPVTPGMAVELQPETLASLSAHLDPQNTKQLEPIHHFVVIIFHICIISIRLSSNLLGVINLAKSHIPKCTSLDWRCAPHRKAPGPWGSLRCLDWTRGPLAVGPQTGSSPSLLAGAASPLLCVRTQTVIPDL